MFSAFVFVFCFFVFVFGFLLLFRFFPLHLFLFFFFFFFFYFSSCCFSSRFLPLGTHTWHLAKSTAHPKLYSSLFLLL